MKKGSVFVFFIMLALCRSAWGFEASVSQTVVPEGESFQLYLRQDGSGETPDISVLNEDFLIVSERKSFKSSYINGRTQSFNENVLTLIPKKTGKVVLPSIRAGREQTKPITLTVVAGGQELPDDPQARQKVKNAQPNVFIRYTIDDKKTYVGQQIPLTVKLYSYIRTPLLDGAVTAPKADGVTTEQWGDVKRSQETVHDKTYDVLIYRFLIFAQKSGKIDLSPVQFRGSISDPDSRSDNMDDFFGMGGSSLFSNFFTQKSIAVQSSPVVINVRPAEAGAAENWLPATQVAVSEDAVPPKKTLPLGEALTRTVTVMAYGARDSQIPDLVFADGPDYKQYPGKTDSKNLFDDKGIIGVKTRQIVFMPTVTGKVVLPSMEIPWFDVKTGKMQKAVLPARTITVTAEDGSMTVPQTPKKTEQTVPAVQVVEQNQPETESEIAEAFSTPPDNAAEEAAAQAFWEKYFSGSPVKLFLAGLAAGGSAVAVLWLLFHFLIFKRKTPSSLNAERTNEKRNGNIAAAEKRLRMCCQSGPAEEVKQALLDWGRAYWSDKPPLTPLELARRMESPALIREASILNEVLYASKNAEWNGEDFWLAFKEACEDLKKKTENEKIPVPPLYPE